MAFIDRIQHHNAASFAGLDVISQMTLATGSKAGMRESSP
jgi:hypothetical protein